MSGFLLSEESASLPAHVLSLAHSLSVKKKKELVALVLEHHLDGH